MKLSDYMRYPHPVLSEVSADYATGQFQAAFQQQLTTEGELKITAELSLDSADLQSLVAGQHAAVGYFLVCRRTYFNWLQEAPLGRSERFFDASRLFGTVTVRPVVWTVQGVERFESPQFHPEFGQSVALAKGAIVALGPEFRFSMDKRKFKPFESIFELVPQDGIEPGTIGVDPGRDKITISAEPKTYLSLAAMRGLARGREILLSAVYMPAVMEVVASLQSGDAYLTSKTWYLVFKAKCDDLGIDPTEKSQSPLRIAQLLLRAPLKKSIALIESL